jgi:hypothetical protein
MKLYYPVIKTQFQDDSFLAALERILHHIFPPNFFEEEDALFRLSNQLPIISWTSLKDPPFDLSFFILCRFRANAFSFFYEMTSRWLIPGKRLNPLLQFAADFSMPELGNQKYIGGEVMLHIENEKEYETLQKNLPIIESEIRLGVDSYYQACRILEIKGLTADEKTALIQENIVSLIKHRPQDFDFDILSEMQHFLVLCKEDFKHSRSWRHMSRIICVHYLFRKALKFSLEVFPERRYINVKLIRATLNQEKKVLGIAIGMSFLREYERFEAQHILSGVQSLIPEAIYLESSFFCNQSRSDPTLAIYLEIEKRGTSSITLAEERLLKEELSLELKNRIEQRLNPIFMPQNEEAIMRHMITLARELKYIRDLPQVMIDFAQQTADKLEFLVVFLRIAKANLKAISSFFERPSFLEYIPDRTKLIGSIGKKCKKEASVFRLRIGKTPFLRKDHSVDLNRARQEIAQELKRLIGDFRDYNGGMLSKENELFENLRKTVKGNPFLLENFFYSLHPAVMRILLPVEALKKLFKMIVDTQRDGLAEEQPYQICMQYDAQFMYMMILSHDFNFREHLPQVLKPYSGRIASCLLQQTEFPCFGLILRDPDKEEALRLRLTVEQTMAELYYRSIKKYFK